MPCRVVSTSVHPPLEPLPHDQVVEGEPRTGLVELHDDPVWSVGVWEHTAGASTDVEADEVFVVLAGRATIEVADGPTLEIGPGDVGILEAGAATTWTVHEPLRKVYVTRGEVPEDASP